MQKNYAYSPVSSRQGCGIVGWLEKISKINSQGKWNSRLGEGGLEKGESLNSQARGGGGWLLKCSFLSFSNLEKHSIKKICVYSKIKIKTNASNKHFKMINRRLFSFVTI